MPYLTRVANAIDGKTSTGQTFHWPAFNGSTSGLAAPGGFDAKYSKRQIDDLTLQIYDMSNNCAFSDQIFPITCPTVVFNGIINKATPTTPPDLTPRTVTGLGRINGLTITGGLTMFSTLGYSWVSQWEFTPINSLRNEFGADTGTRLSGTGSPTDPAVIAHLQKEVIPVNLTIPPSSPHFTGTASLLLRTSDPLVNQFPGDWEPVPNPRTSDVTIEPTGTHFTYCKGGALALDPDFGPHQNSGGTPVYDFDGDNFGFKPVNNGDPVSVWLPRSDIRYPKQSRFPSVGALNYIRTGRIPDDLTAAEDQQHGTPWRSINLSKLPPTSPAPTPLSSSQTIRNTTLSLDVTYPETMAGVITLGTGNSIMFGVAFPHPPDPPKDENGKQLPYKFELHVPDQSPIAFTLPFPGTPVKPDTSR